MDQEACSCLKNTTLVSLKICAGVTKWPLTRAVIRISGSDEEEKEGVFQEVEGKGELGDGGFRLGK